MAIKIGEILLRRGLITVDGLNRALTMHRRSGARLGVCLVRLGYVDEDSLAAALGEQLGVPVAPADALDDVPAFVIARVPQQVAEAHNIVPIRVEGREVHVCLADPQNLSRLDEIAFTLGCRIRPFLATEPAIERALARYYKKSQDWNKDGNQDGNQGGKWKEALNRTGEWRTEQTGSWHFNLEENPPPLPVVEAEVPMVEPDALLPRAVVEAAPSDPYERLAAVLSREDLVAALSDFFGRLFMNLCVVEVVTGGARCVALRRDGQPCALSADSDPISIEGAGWLIELLAHPQIVVRRQIADLHLQDLLRAHGIASSHVAVVPVFDYGRLKYVLLAQGLGADDVKGIFGELKPYLSALSEAMRLISLRELIRRRARRPGPALDVDR
jgi:hypothetical protein